MSKINLEIALVSSIVVITIIVSSLVFVHINYIMHNQTDYGEHELTCILSGYSSTSSDYVTIYFDNGSVNLYGPGIFNSVKGLNLSEEYTFIYKPMPFDSKFSSEQFMECEKIIDSTGRIVWKSDSVSLTVLNIAVFIVAISVMVFLVCLWGDKHGRLEKN